MQNELPIRKKIRLEGYDYSSTGAYFITICVKNKHKILGKINVGAAFCRPISTTTSSHPISTTTSSSHPINTASVQLTEYGIIVANEIEKLSSTYNHVTMDKYVVMPNHIHMIIAIKSGGRQNAAPTVSRMINQWKRAVSIKIGFSLWQRSYHDHIIRSDTEYQKIWQYIDENPAKWEHNELYKKH